MSLLTGAGTTVMTNQPNNRILSDGPLRTLTVGAGHTLQGSGNIGLGSSALQMRQPGHDSRRG